MRAKIYTSEEWETCPLCEEAWCPRCETHCWECPCLTESKAKNQGWSITECGKWAVRTETNGVVWECPNSQKTSGEQP